MSAVVLAGLLAAHPITVPFAGRMDEYAPAIDRCATQYGLDRIQIMAVILLESAGQSDAFNRRSWATGLMQVMPSEAGPLFVNRPSSEQLKDASVNLDWGCRILSGLMQRHGTLKKALYHYSGGIYWDVDGNQERAFAKYESYYWRRYELFSNALIDLALGKHALESL